MKKKKHIENGLDKRRVRKIRYLVDFGKFYIYLSVYRGISSFIADSLENIKVF